MRLQKLIYNLLSKD